jgi:hypothetical protein
MDGGGLSTGGLAAGGLAAGAASVLQRLLSCSRFAGVAAQDSREFSDRDRAGRGENALDDWALDA